MDVFFYLFYKYDGFILFELVTSIGHIFSYFKLLEKTLKIPVSMATKC